MDISRSVCAVEKSNCRLVVGVVCVCLCVHEADFCLFHSHLALQEIKRRTYRGSERERSEVLAAVPRSTVYDALKRLGDEKDISLETVFPAMRRKGRQSLLSEGDTRVLQDIVVIRGYLNDGCS